jgi:hypothetical protein
MRKAIIAIVAASACGGSISDTDPDPTNGGNGFTPPTAGPTSGGSNDTFNHDNNQISPWDLIAREEIEGPPSFTSHMHSCAKIFYATLGQVLTDNGISITDNTMYSAGQIYQASTNALAAPDFANAIRENLALTTSGASAQFDILAAAAPTIITNLPNLARCQVNGAGPELFDSNNQCQLAGISCLLGVPATQDYVDLCNIAVSQASTPQQGESIAVASILAASLTCE